MQAILILMIAVGAVAVNLESINNDHADQCLHDCHRRGRCVDGECICSSGWGGKFCDQPRLWCPSNCNGHGLCDSTTQVCSCDRGFGGADCSRVVPVCPSNCRGHGTCNETSGLCECSTGFAGRDCAVVVPNTCPMECSSRGSCLLGRCWCDEGFMGPGCELAAPSCENACSGHGRCESGSCLCELGYEGSDCSLLHFAEHAIPRANASQLHGPFCRDGCSGRGLCKRNGYCECSMGWFGESCAEYHSECPNFCSGHGVCAPDFTCRCQSGYSGADCSQMGPIPQSCPANCSGEGACVAADPWSAALNSPQCRCYQDSFSGAACNIFQEAKPCPSNCSGHGMCHEGGCICVADFSGSACEIPEFPCPRNCSGRGQCQPGGACQCLPGFAGPDCATREKPCPRGCSGHGYCVDGTCQCDSEWLGNACNMTCPHKCSMHGKCTHGVCECDQGWTGVACQIVDVCPNDCNDAGICRDGICHCNPGLSGDDCSMDGEDDNTLPPDCTGHLGGCSGHGTCVWDSEARAESCSCNEGWLDVDCSRELLGTIVEPPSYENCSVAVAKECTDRWVTLGCPSRYALQPQCFPYRHCQMEAKKQQRCVHSSNSTNTPIAVLSAVTCGSGRAATCMQTWVANGCSPSMPSGCEAYDDCKQYSTNFCPVAHHQAESVDCEMDDTRECVQEWTEQGCPVVGFVPSPQCEHFTMCALASLVDPKACTLVR